MNLLNGIDKKNSFDSLKEIKELIKKYPNDQELGREIRKLLANKKDT